MNVFWSTINKCWAVPLNQSVSQAGRPHLRENITNHIFQTTTLINNKKHEYHLKA